jgi:plastocyanin
MRVTMRVPAVVVVTLALVVSAGIADAAEVRALVTDAKTKGIPEAVVVAVPEGGVAVAPRSAVEIVDQIDQEFVPYVKPILVGSAVSFPNRDNIRHHVYSFSPAKRFELPLYIGTPAKPVVFDRPGVVTLGCNIHDWMVGHLYVSESPYFGKTDDNGRVTLVNLPAGRYTVRAWHPRMEEAEEATRRPVTLEASAAADLAWSLTIRRDLRVRRSTSPSRGYR